MIIENINENNKNLVLTFIKRIPTIEIIEEDVLENIVLIRNEKEVLGIISYENYLDKGLIRYFIFQKDVAYEELEKLFKTMKEKAKNDEIKHLITVIEEKELVTFFNKLGFKKIDTDKIYLFETSLVDTIYSNAIVMTNEI
jgi:N-acetylglutamate synthase-like GNAT family acetyltransferase